MTTQLSGMLVDALDALELAEIGVREVIADIDVEADQTDNVLLAALEHLAVAGTLIATRRVIHERKEAEAKATERDDQEARRQASKDRGRQIMERAGVGEKAIEATLNSPGVEFQNRLRGISERPERPEASLEPGVERITIRELARELDISDSQMHRWVRDGKIKTYKLPGTRARIIKPADVHLLRSVAATKPADRTAAPWIGKALNRAGR